jgi:hypothetical protein
LFHQKQAGDALMGGGNNFGGGGGSISGLKRRDCEGS